MAGLVLVGVGCWAFSEKNRLSSDVVDVNSLQSKYSDVFDVVFDLTVLIIVLGVVVFVLSFVGCVGALRENICFLKCVRIGLLQFTFKLIFEILCLLYGNRPVHVETYAAIPGCGVPTPKI